MRKCASEAFVCPSLPSLRFTFICLPHPVTIIRTSRPCTENWLDLKRVPMQVQVHTHSICLSIIGRRVTEVSHFHSISCSLSILLQRMCANVFISYCDLAASISCIPLLIISSAISGNTDCPVPVSLYTCLTFQSHNSICSNTHVVSAWEWGWRRLRSFRENQANLEIWVVLWVLPPAHSSSSSAFLYWAHLWSLNCTFLPSLLLTCSLVAEDIAASPHARTFLPCECWLSPFECITTARSNSFIVCICTTQCYYHFVL